MIDLLKVFSDETRLRVLRLCETEELSVNELAAILDMAQPRISNQLRLLRESGLLHDRREGTWAYYRMPPAAAIPASTHRLWEDVKGWMRSERVHPEDIARREQALRARVAPAEKYFEAVGAGWDDIGLRLVDETMRERLLLCLIPAKSVVADVGCGGGQFLSLLAPHVGRAIGVDPSAKMLSLSRERARKAGLRNVELRRGGLEKLPLKEGEADAVFCNLVLHHSSRPGEAVAGMTRALRPGGRLSICDFAAHREDWMREEMADFWLGFEPDALKSWMRRAGLRAPRVSSIGRAAVRPERHGRRAADLEILWAVADKPDNGR